MSDDRRTPTLEPLRLAQYWDALSTGRTPDPTSLDPALIDAIDRFQAIAVQERAPRPNPQFVHHLLEDLMTTATSISADAVTRRSAHPLVPNGRTAWPQMPTDRLVPPPRIRWSLGALATAALVVLVLLGSVAVFGPGRALRHEAAPAFVPRFVSTPATPTATDKTPAAVASALPGATEDTLLLQQRFDEIPADAAGAGVDRATLAPGDAWSVGTEETNGVGPMLFRVETGPITLRADHAIPVMRAGAQAATEIAKDTDVALNPGDIAYLRSGVAAEWHNTGTSKAVLLDAGLTTNGSSQALPQTSLIGAWPITPPPAPVQLTVRRLTLAPGASVPNAPAPGLVYVGAETGTLTIVWAARADPTVATTSATLAAGLSLDINAPTYVAKELRNDGTTPLVLWLMTVTPMRTDAATPAA